MDTLFPDLSDHNERLNDKVIKEWRRWSKWVSFRAVDGTYLDQNFQANASWCQKNDKEIIGIINYMVYPPSVNNGTVDQTVSAFLARLTSRDHSYCRKIVAMIDVESWGRWHADKSNELNAAYHGLWIGLNSLRPKWQRNTIGIKRFFRRVDKRRVIGYGNAGDLNTLWRKKPEGMRIVLANYSSNTKYPGEIIHQFSSHYDIPGLGFVDINTADGLSPRKLARKLGLWKLVRSI